MSSKAVTPKTVADMTKIERVLIKGDLADLTPEECVAYYNRVCETLGLNPLTRPFEYIELNRKLVLYATKGCAEQLRSIHKISIRISARETIDGVYVVTAQATGRNGRVDESTGAVATAGLRGDVLANAYLKCETKAKRRVTLSICGLNMLDETEVESIVEPSAAPVPPQSKPLPPPQAATAPKQEEPLDRGKLAHEAYAIALKLNLTDEDIADWVRDEFQKDLKAMTDKDLDQFLVMLHQALRDKQQIGALV